MRIHVFYGTGVAHYPIRTDDHAPRFRGGTSGPTFARTFASPAPTSASNSSPNRVPRIELEVPVDIVVKPEHSLRFPCAVLNFFDRARYSTGSVDIVASIYATACANRTGANPVLFHDAMEGIGVSPEDSVQILAVIESA